MSNRLTALLVRGCASIERRGFFYTDELLRPAGEELKRLFEEAGFSVTHEIWPPTSGIHAYWAGDNQHSAHIAIQEELQRDGFGDLVR